MKILKIGGKNLASLAGEFCVDFEREPLASAGLFAISGPTGAGKSTLLDALCLALYDATPRLVKALGRSLLPDVGSDTISSQDSRTLLRRGAAEGYAEVDFVGNDGKAYRARWSVRRSRTKAEGALQPTAMSLHQLPALQAIGNTKTEVKGEIERRIGLSFEQFTRAVLLAQNEFATFLKAEDNERGELLETLTGTTIYSDISRRAFERAKDEQLALQRLNDQLAGQQPLGSDARAMLETDASAAAQALAALDQQQADLETQLRWHQQAERLQQGELQASEQWQRALLDQQAAATRRAALARSEAVQAARPLADACSRIAAERSRNEAAIASHAAAAEQARLAQQQCAASLAGATAALETASADQRQAAPQLDQAKALDARLAALLPAHEQASEASAAAARADASARTALQDKQEQQRQLVAAQQAGNDWLARHRQWQALAQAWPRWDVLFIQAGQSAAHAERLAQSLGRLQQKTASLHSAAEQAETRLTAARSSMAELEAQRQQANAALAAFPAEQLQEQRAALEQRRTLLAGADKLWSELTARQQRHNQLAADTQQLQAAGARAATELAQAQEQHAAIQAALAQAERSLKLAEAACAENVETLRAALEEDSPCPVCGALDHPYRHNDGPMHAMLASLQAEVQRCRDQSRHNIEQQASARASGAASAVQLDRLAQEASQLQVALAQLEASWHAHPLQQDSALPAPEQRGDWFSAQLLQASEALQELARQQQAMQQASAARELAQQACDRAAAEQASLLEMATQARSALTQASVEHKGLDEQRIEAQLQLDALLDELDAAFSDGELPSEGWKDEWKAGPARFHTARQADSKQWLTHRAACDERAAAIAGVEIELNALETALAGTGAAASAARQAWQASELRLQEVRRERMALWGGAAVAQVEARLQEAVDAARARLTQQQSAAEQAALATTRRDEALAQATQRRAVLDEEAAAAAAALAAWLDSWPQREPDHAPLDREELLALLAQTADMIAAERRALQALDNAVASADAVLKERQNQRLLHQASAPADDAVTAEALAAALETLAGQRQQAQRHASALQVALAQDDARRQQAQSMLAAIAAQEEIERRWARMNELIGSADGKKFRNYAQQFTLEVLLGYANAHLRQLARRYQLERINNPAHPSLGLLVRDQDMGGEMRSVHSLSGGEAFLVSLALALGLASLSSNRVRVESLFIDEGFGSLDADTLRVAMDALDGLQSMGRKVGVISHVQEMTERIATKILVQPAAGGKSAVSVA